MLTGLNLRADKNAAGYFVIRHPQPPIAAIPATDLSSPLEELVVTGTNIRGGLLRNLNPIEVVDRQTLETSGSPSMIDLVSTLPVVSGTENQSNQFRNANAAGTANINLRGLGVSRTLVLLNGKRLPASSLPHNDGQAFVDINSIPAIALEQVDILKNGASATYGSDAVAGVVNFITRDRYDGVELQASGKYIDESDGDWDLSLLGGGQWGQSHWLAAFNYTRRSELKNASREEILAPRVDIPELNRMIYTVSSIGNPGAFIPINAATASAGLTDAEVSAAATDRNNYVRDPNCTDVGGYLIDGARCGFNYVSFDNLVEKEDHWQAFTRWQRPLATNWLGDASQAYVEINYADTRVPAWKTSPSYPPVNEADANRYLPADHPGLLDFIARNPGVVENDGDVADFSGGAIFVGRPVGVSGPVTEGVRSQQTLRLLTGVRGEYGANAGASGPGSFDLSLAYARSQAEARTKDVLIDRWQSALQGFGGENCRGTEAGQNGCLYYTPFASAIAFSPNHQPALANDPQLLDWMRAEGVQNNISQLWVADALVTGSLNSDRVNSGLFKNRTLPDIDYALGLQYRNEQLQIRFNDLADVSVNPGEVSTPGELPGAFVFFRGGQEDDVSQNVVALFGELAMPVSDRLYLQLALRFEHYGGNIGQSLDPKIALRWDLTPSLSLRASSSTTFRAPSLNQTGLETTSLSLIGAAYAYKAVDRIGNPNLKPEQSVSSSLGLLWTPTDRWHINLDYWHINIDDLIIQESANAIVNATQADPASQWASQIIYDGSGNISRILSHYINGPDLVANGVDFHSQYHTPAGSGELMLGVDLAYLQRYDVSASDLIPAFSADGRLNSGTFLKSLPKWQGKLYLNYARGAFNGRLELNGISAYTDDGLNILSQTALDQYITETTVAASYLWDLHLNWALPGEATAFSLSVLNLADREPPVVREDMRFDTSLHNAFGRMVKVRLQHRF
nr:TonB-dependent receptor [Aestuariicella hydrocarbonica]